MLNKSEILSGLSEEQKIALVSDVYSATADALNAVGVPHLEKTSLDALNAVYGGVCAYPEFASLASSWNLKLIASAAGDAVAYSRSCNLIETPPMYLRTGACASGIAEDPYLIAKITDACVSAIDGSGVSACVIGGIRNIDAEYLDPVPSDNVISNITGRAAEAVLRTKKPAAAALSLSRLKGDWKNVNERFAESVVQKSLAHAVIAADASEEKFRSSIDEPVWFFAGASSSALRSALKNYRRMKDDVEHGAIGAEELEKAVSAGTAISAETLDAAAYKALEFIEKIAARSVARPMRSEADRKNGALFAAAESIVMLKNQSVLPIAPRAKLAVVGDTELGDVASAASSACSLHGMSFVGYAKGYSSSATRSDELIPEAAELAKSADTVLVIVGFGKKRFYEHESLTLPANQAALIDAMVKSGKKVIAAVVGDVLPSMDFDEHVSAVLYVPASGAQTLRALFDIVCGAVSPSGKLTFTAYDDADSYYAERKKALSLGKYKVGEFIGYRRYTTENTKVKYPFGFGLSYGKFTYSALRINADNIEVTVKNTGARTAAEVAQLYIGKKNSALVRPLRELKGFAKVLLEPGKAMQIKFPVSAAMLEVFDPSDGKRKTESGAYEVYVGASSTDIKLSGSMNYSGDKIAAATDKLSDYLPSLSNIVDGGYRMSAVGGARGAFKSARPSDEAVSYETLFADEFGSDDGDEEAVVAQSEEDDILCYLDDSITVKTAIDGLVKFALGCGVKIDSGFASELTAAFSASRVVLLRCDKTEFDMLAMMLCDYFGCPNGIDDASHYASPDDLFGGGETALMKTLSFAAAKRENVAVALLDGVKPDALGKVFVPFIRYAASPDDMKLFYGANKQEVPVAKNVWFMMRLAEEKCVFPAYIADMATVLVPRIEFAPQSGDGARVYAPNFYQLTAAFKRAERDRELDELHWKKVDRLENYVAARARFKVDNKMSVQMEKYVAVLLEYGMSPVDALDSAVAAKLVPYAASAVDGKLSSDDVGLVQTLDGVFGEEGATRGKALIRKLSSFKEGV